MRYDDHGYPPDFDPDEPVHCPACGDQYCPGPGHPDGCVCPACEDVHCRGPHFDCPEARAFFEAIVNAEAAERAAEEAEPDHSAQCPECGAPYTGAGWCRTCAIGACFAGPVPPAIDAEVRVEMAVEAVAKAARVPAGNAGALAHAAGMAAGELRKASRAAARAARYSPHQGWEGHAISMEEAALLFEKIEYRARKGRRIDEIDDVLFRVSHSGWLTQEIKALDLLRAVAGDEGHVALIIEAFRWPRNVTLPGSAFPRPPWEHLPVTIERIPWD